MTTPRPPDQAAMKTIFAECRQCGTCCRSYRKIGLRRDEVHFIRSMGGHVGYEICLNDLRDKSMDQLTAEAEAADRVYMIHPDDRGCVFLVKRNDRYQCGIYHHRPRTCRAFRCTLADSSFFDLFAADSIRLLGQDRFGLPLAGRDPVP